MSTEPTNLSQQPLKPRAVPAPPDERRSSPRFIVDRDVEIRPLDDVLGRRLAAHLVDLSAGGIGIRMTRPLARGREFVLVLPEQAASSAVSAIAHASGAGLCYRVVNCRPERDGRFFIGCSFVRAAAEARRTASLLKRAAAGPDATAGGASAAA